MNIDDKRLYAMGLAEALDYFRIVPRLILVSYSYMMYEVIQWFMDLTNPNAEQAGFVVSVIGIAGVIISLYHKSGRNWTNTIPKWNNK